MDLFIFTNSETAFESWSPGDGQRQHGPALCWTAPSNSGLPKLNQLDVLCLYMIIYRYIIVTYALDMQFVQISHGVMKLSIRPDQLVWGHLLLHIWLSRGCRLRFWWRYSQWINIKGSRKKYRKLPRFTIECCKLAWSRLRMKKAAGM